MSGGTQREQIIALRARVARLERLVAELELRSRIVVPAGEQRVHNSRITHGQTEPVQTGT